MDHSRSHVLVIDDHRGMAEKLAEMVERAGFRASWAGGGTDGVAAFRAAHAAGSPFAAIVTDFSMADLDGLALAALMKGVSPLTPVILLTAYAIHVPDDELPPHIDAILAKPPSSEELRSTLARLTTRT